MEEIGLPQHRRLIAHADVRDVSTTLGDGAAAGPLARHQAAACQCVGHGDPLGPLGLGDDGVRGLSKRCFKGREVKVCDVTLAEQRSRGCVDLRSLLLPVDEVGELLGECPLGLSCLWSLTQGLLERLDLLMRAEGEHPQQRRCDGVLAVEPELEEGVRGGQPVIEPHRAGLRLAELGAIGLGHQRSRERVDARSCDTADQINASDDVAPLVRATCLEGAATLLVELKEVIGLEQLVAELGVGDPGTGQSCGDRFAIEHAVDAEVLAHVTEELQGREPLGPVVVVHHGRRVGGGVEVEESLELLTDAPDPLVDHLGLVQGALPRFFWVTDHPGGTTDECEGLVAGDLEPANRQDLQQVAHVQARRRRVEAAVERDRCLGCCRAERVKIRRLGDEAAPLEVIEHGHPGSGLGAERAEVEGGCVGWTGFLRCHGVILAHLVPR